MLKFVELQFLFLNYEKYQREYKLLLNNYKRRTKKKKKFKYIDIKKRR